MDFEKPRGVSRIEVRDGYVQVHVLELGSPLIESRLNVLGQIKEAGISLDFLKFIQDGLSFLVEKSQEQSIRDVLGKTGVKFNIQPGRSVLMVHAANMRDEEGLIAKIVSIALGSLFAVDHVSDMHDRILIVTASSDVKSLEQLLKTELFGDPS